MASSMDAVFLTLAVLALSFTNGANDNCKGVGTLLGAGRARYSSALVFATIATLLGSFAAFYFGKHLVATFSGKGLVPDAYIGDFAFVIPVALGAAATVGLATRFGFPISTTHSLVGSLLGAGLVLAGSETNFSRVFATVVLPLLSSPLLAALLTFLLYMAFRSSRKALGIGTEPCLCIDRAEGAKSAARIDEQRDSRANGAEGRTAFAQAIPGVTRARTGQLLLHLESCPQTLRGRELGIGKLLRIDAQRLLDFFHYGSAATLSFARGLNDTPKIVALLAAGSILGIGHASVLVAIAMAAGALIAARRVAHRVSHEITPMNDGQGFTANLVSAILVLFATRLGMPVSTTHVSVGALFGLRAHVGASKKSAMASIVWSWALTVPVAMLLSASFAVIYRAL